MDEQTLSKEEAKKEYCIKVLRNNGDMSEDATMKVMEMLTRDPDLLNKAVGSVATSSSTQPFAINEQFGIIFITLPSPQQHQKRKECAKRLTTRIGDVTVSSIMNTRLHSLYVEHNPIDMLTPEYLLNYSRRVFLLLFRYSYIDPNYSRQKYLAPKYWSGIKNAFGRSVDLEALAAAFNATIPSYCSLFPDVESPFGSRGSFFDLKKLKDEDIIIEVNPPRNGFITESAVRHCIKLLDSSKGTTTRYIILLTPLAWLDIEQLIKSTDYLVWQNRVDSPRQQHIEYHDVVSGLPFQFPMPRVSILSSSKAPLLKRVSDILHETFSS